MQAPRVLRYAELPTRVGRVAVAMSRSGVVDIVLADHYASPSDLVSRLRLRFPDTLLVPDDGVHGSWAAAAVARINGAHAEFAAPIDLAWPLAVADPRLTAPAMRPAVSAPAARSGASAPVAYEYAT